MRPPRYRSLRLVGRACSFALAATAAFPALARAQGTATLRGTVTSGIDHEPLAEARVSIDVPPRVAITNGAGRYTLRDVPAGRYDVVFTALGHTPLHRTIELAAGQNATLDVELEPGSLMLSSVITTARRAPAPASDVAATVNVLSPEQIRTSPARESQDLLREIPGVELPRTSSNVGGSAQIVSIRGVDEGRTAVFFDGIPVTDAWGEWIDWSRVPKALLDHVEVIEGGGSSLYGNPAMGGVISFFSHPIAPGSYQLQVDGGDRDARHVFASAGVPLGSAFSAMVSGDYGDGGGYTLVEPSQRGAIDQRSTSIRRNAMARIEYAPSSRLTAFLGGQLFSDDRNLGTPLSRDRRRNGLLDLGVDYRGTAGALFSVRAWDSDMREDQYATSIAADRSSERLTSWQHIPSHDWGGSVQWSRGDLFGFESVTAGADVRHLGGRMAEQDYTVGGDTVFIHSGGDQLLTGVFAQGVLAPLSRLRIELGARVDRWGNDNGFATDSLGTTKYADKTRSAFSPRLGIKYQVTSSLSLHTAVYRAFRAPNLAELYRKFFSGTNENLPNPGLEPEHVTGEEVGFSFQPAPWVQLKGTVYNADMRDLNTFVTIAPGQRQRQNVQKTQSQGGEVYLALRPVEPLFVSASLNYDDDRIVAGPTPASIGTRVGRVPLQRAVIRGTYSTAKLGALTLLWRYEGVSTTFSGARLKSFSVVDANYQRDLLPGTSAFISVENVGDTDYQVNLSGAIVSLGMPRTIRAGVSVGRD
ncbi:MAG: TonB-dependent receptor [Gemmatimonadaceae bacterium]|nr:TonB-dependent receptor [Gemmatimonadaceae bacterium]